MSFPKIISAAGFMGRYAPNTMAGIAAALALKPDAIEVDVALTGDGVPVVAHGPTLHGHFARKAGAWIGAEGLVIAHQTFDALQAYDIGVLRPGSPYEAIVPNMAQHAGARIPALAHVLDLFARQADAPPLILDLKTDPQDPERSPDPALFLNALAADLRRWGPHLAVSLGAFDWDLLMRAHAALPGVPLGLISHGFAPGTRYAAETPSAWTGSMTLGAGDSPSAEALRRAGVSKWTVALSDAAPDVVAAAHEAGIEISVWGMHGDLVPASLIDAGVDWVTCLRPDLAMAQRQRSVGAG